MLRRSTGLKERIAEMSNRAQRRQRNKKRNPHKADIGIKTQLVREHAIDIAVNRHLQIFMWIVVVALNDELGLGQTRTRRVLSRIEDVRSEWDKMRKDVDLDYANEKLRKRAEEISGIEIGYVEDSIRQAMKNEMS